MKCTILIDFFDFLKILKKAKNCSKNWRTNCSRKYIAPLKILKCEFYVYKSRILGS